MPPKATKTENQAAGQNEAATEETVSAGPQPTHRIVGHGQNGFYRAGRHWPQEGVDVVRDDFTDDQWAALEAEPKLSIKTL